MTRASSAILKVSGLLLLLGLAPTGAGAQSLISFGVLAGSTITNTGAGTTINGNVGLYPGTDIPGLLPIQVLPPYAIHQTDAIAAQAKSDLTTAYNILASRPATATLTGMNLGTLGGSGITTLGPGVYSFADSAQLIGNLTLDGQGNANSIFIFNIGSTLTTASASSISLIGGAVGANVFFRVGSSATLGTTTDFVGEILADQSISLSNGATITCGAALARIGAVTLINNTIISADALPSCRAPTTSLGTTLPATATANDRALAAAIDAFVAGGGTLPLGFQVLAATLTPAELAAAFSELAGETATGVGPSGIQGMNSFLSLVLNSGFDSRVGPGVITAPAEITPAPPAPATPLPGRGTVKALDYGPEESPNRIGAIFAPFDRARFTPRRWDMWAAAFGGLDNTNGDAATGSHDTTSSNFGFAAGIDYSVTPETRLGVALSTGGTSFDLADSLGGGSSNMYQAAIYGRTSFNAAYLSAALAYGWYDESTDRNITISGEHLSADFSAHDIAGRIEGGYKFGSVTPYAAVQVQSFSTPAYGETSDLGASIFALNYDANTTTDTRSELGVRVERTMILPRGETLGLRGRAAWAHDFWSSTDVVATFQSLPGAPFVVSGATPSSDWFLLSGGAEWGFRNGFSLGSWVDTAFARGSQSYSGNVRVRYVW